VESNVIFEGPGPFHLPVAQRAIAVGHTNNGVTATVYCLVAKSVGGVEVDRGSEPEPISVQMLSSVARDLAVALMRAADEAEAQSSRPR